VDAHEDMLDTGTEKTGKSVSVDLTGDVLFLIRGNGIAGSAPREVPVANVYRDGKAVFPRDDARQYLKPGEHLDLSLGAAKYRLAARGRYDPTRPEYDMLLLDYRMTLTRLSDGRQQTIEAPARFAEDGVPTLIWAGDLDHDGALDLYMDLTNHYNVTEYTLFLSSSAGPGRLVHKVASKRYVGC
jgi:hypothetical protein